MSWLCGIIAAELHNDCLKGELETAQGKIGTAIGRNIVPLQKRR